MNISELMKEVKPIMYQIRRRRPRKPEQGVIYIVGGKYWIHDGKEWIRVR